MPRELCSSDELIESPFEGHNCSVQFRFKFVGLELINFRQPPAPWLLPWHPGRSAGPRRKRPLQFERGRPVVPVCHIRHISPRRRQDGMPVNRTGGLPGNVAYGPPPDARREF